MMVVLLSLVWSWRKAMLAPKVREARPGIVSIKSPRGTPGQLLRALIFPSCVLGWLHFREAAWRRRMCATVYLIGNGHMTYVIQSYHVS